MRLTGTAEKSPSVWGGGWIWGDRTFISCRLPSLVFIQVLITEFLESSSCLLRAAGAEINKIEPLALNYWDSTLSDVKND